MTEPSSASCRFCRSVTSAYEEIHVISLSPEGRLLMGGREVERATLLELKNGMAMMETNPAWRVMMDNMRKDGVNVLVRSQDFDQALVGKTMLLLVDEMEKTVMTVRKAKE